MCLSVETAAALEPVFVHSRAEPDGIAGELVKAIKELVRRLAQQSIARGARSNVSMEDPENILQDMLGQSGKLNQALLGAGSAREKPQVRIVGDQCF
ncbi:hypothetical protein WT25_16295 [Burkholderia territorii]|uniref:hypothetical protein n=1 Tax=Burkholderia territorii TaxID=1503055 RepID=UPI0007576F78|nr:hypothetical protein [Burkholderia territorii]KVT81252.1 hypothetical protein WT25_16295 [Burkholderia territorii]